MVYGYESERNNEEQDRHLLAQSVKVFQDIAQDIDPAKQTKKLHIYTNDFEKHLIEHAGVYYQRKSREWLDQDSCPAYLEKVDRVLTGKLLHLSSLLLLSCYLYYLILA